MSVEDLFNWIERGCTLVVITMGFLAGLVYWHLKCRIKVIYQKSWPVPEETDGCLHPIPRTWLRIEVRA